MVDMKKAIAKCSHEDAPELSLPPYRSAYRFTNDMATMFAKMMHHMKNRNTFSPYSAISSNSHHGDSKMDTMKMMMQMMKMKNMMRDNDHTYSSSSYNSDSDMFDMFSDMFDNYEQKDNYRSSS